MSGFVDLERFRLEPTAAEVWERFANEIPGKFEKRVWQTPRVVAHIDCWTITMDGLNSSSSITRMRVPFLNVGNFRFDIRSQNALLKFRSLLGMKTIDIGDTDFHSQFVVTSSDEIKVRQFLDDFELKSLLQKQQTGSFRIVDTGGILSGYVPANCALLWFETWQAITDVTLLHSLLDLFARTLRRLNELGYASHADPEVTL